MITEIRTGGGGGCFGLKTETNLIITSQVFTVINFTGLCSKTVDHCLSSTVVYYSETWGIGIQSIFIKGFLSRSCFLLIRPSVPS